MDPKPETALVAQQQQWMLKNVEHHLEFISLMEQKHEIERQQWGTTKEYLETQRAKGAGKGVVFSLIFDTLAKHPLTAKQEEEVRELAQRLLDATDSEDFLKGLPATERTAAISGMRESVNGILTRLTEPN